MISVLKLHSVTLKFPDATMENAFLRRRTNGLLSVFFKTTVLVFLTAVASLGMNDSERESQLCVELSSTFASVASINWRMKVVLIVFAFAVCILVKIPMLVKHAGYACREYALVAFVHVAMLITVICDFYYMSRMYIGADPKASCPRNTFTDKRVLLVINAIFSLTHAALPLRWCVVWTVELVGILLYLGLAYGVGSPERDLVPTSAMFLFCVAVASGFGKRKTELYERHAFWLWLTEKSMRAQAEFKYEVAISTVQPSAPGEEEDVEIASTKRGSLPSTTGTGQVFKHTSAANVQDKMEEVLEMGLREKWLVNRDALTMHTKVLGRGTFGVVAVGSFHGTAVALKVPTTQTTTQDIQNLPTLLNELRILRHVRHPNIVLFSGACFVGDDRNSLVLVFELCNGTTMDSWIRGTAGSPAPTDTALHTGLLGVCCALRYLHSQEPNIVHGDLKAKNVMIECRGGSPHAKLLDFGCSRVLTRNAKPLGGTMYWKAPEVVKRSPEKPHVSSDVYSYGCLIYFTMTSTLPLSGLSKAKVLSALQGTKLPPLVWPQDARLLVPGSKGLIEGCLRFKIEDRLDINDVYAELVKWTTAADISEDSTTSGMVSSGVSDTTNSNTIDLQSGVVWVRSRPKGNSLLENSATGNNANSPPRDGDTGGKSEKRTGISTKPSTQDATFRTEDHQLAVPSFQATPQETQKLGLVMSMLPWNIPIPVGSCCGFHAALQHLDGLAAALKREKCKKVWHFNVEAQCPHCLALIMDIAQDGHRPECPVCFQACTTDSMESSSVTGPIKVQL